MYYWDMYYIYAHMTNKKSERKLKGTVGLPPSFFRSQIDFIVTFVITFINISNALTS